MSVGDTKVNDTKVNDTKVYNKNVCSIISEALGKSYPYINYHLTPQRFSDLFVLNQIANNTFWPTSNKLTRTRLAIEGGFNGDCIHSCE